MSVVRLSNGGALVEDRYSFPDPEIVIRTVFRLDDIKFLKPRHETDSASIVYFYDDRDYLNNLTHYTGETAQNPQTRFKNTHQRKAWLNSIKYPLVGMAESLVQPWDVDTRKTIESLCAYKMKTYGFDVVNSETMNWSHGVQVPPNVNGAYVESVARIITDYQVALLGLAGSDIRELTGQSVEEMEFTVEAEANEEAETLFTVKNPERLRIEEKLDILLKTGHINLGEPLHVTHHLVNKVVIIRAADNLEYQGHSYSPREAIKTIAHEIFSNGTTHKQAEGWSGYNPLHMLAVERLNEKIKLEQLWNQVKHRVTGLQETNDVVDEEWLTLVMTHNLIGAKLYCNGKESTVGPNAIIQADGKEFLSLVEFGEYANGLNDAGWADYSIVHEGERYTIQSD